MVVLFGETAVVFDVVQQAGFITLVVLGLLDGGQGSVMLQDLSQELGIPPGNTGI
ncbi:hypothetical protein CFII64_16282 [Pseudomonas sp. CFII64]|nr:hypothetical protein CFII64_16282 [Pseudomonas sp. CFII64]